MAISVLLFAHIERFSVCRMLDFKFFVWCHWKKGKQIKSTFSHINFFLKIDYLHHFVKNRFLFTCDTWHVTKSRDAWHMTHRWWGNILSKCQVPSSNSLGVMIFWISHNAVCRTAPATPGLLNTRPLPKTSIFLKRCLGQRYMFGVEHQLGGKRLYVW